ncbi:MAG: ABC transporter permease [Candidatus Methanomethylicia archaeon]
MGLGKTLALKGLTLIIVLISVLLFTVLIIGASGLSDRILNSIMNEELRGIRQKLTTQIRDPEELNKAIERIRQDLVKAYGLDKPWYARIPNMILRIVTLDLGSAREVQTFTGSNKISDIIIERIPNTILLMTSALIINFILGLLIGPRVALKHGTRIDRATSLYSAISYALPTWWLGMLMILFFSFQLRIFPFGGMYSAPPHEDPFMRFLDLLWHVMLPLITLVLALSGSWIYITRSIVLSVAQEDFVNVARVKGLPEDLVRRRYIVRVAAPPILTNIVLGLAGSIAGAILTEIVFDWPGMGTLYYKAVMSVDESLILALTYIFTLIYVLARFILEILYVVLDPRVRL